MNNRLIEADKSYREGISRDIDEEKKKLQLYWSDPRHLEEKLLHVTRTINEQRLLPQDQVSRLAIHSGTGSVVLQKEDGKYHYVEVDMPVDQEPLYISLKATLPENEIPNLFTYRTFTLLPR